MVLVKEIKQATMTLSELPLVVIRLLLKTFVQQKMDFKEFLSLKLEGVLLLKDVF